MYNLHFSKVYLNLKSVLFISELYVKSVYLNLFGEEGRGARSS
jgi:hypothetical protein